ncbi:hypothetical protein LLH06_15825 [Mucilaginibacter daejeonensis]|uniref:hypothetical protein n=1 Tax=Mucilaginibacter daejeonensis TaxID=398049 RepID=UPI001D175B2C|nr:hypothetical protein [Mucilaginibacter daejeonensis]UEG52427.1 hypothetical protein LLH06_15825 [Mucilaginibacter daejeonensis]
MTSNFKLNLFALATLAAGIVLNPEARAQNLSSLQNSFNAYQRAAVTEKIYVHTNKELYLTGEVLWFKLYNVDGDSNRPLNLSKVAYIEILNAENVPVLQTKVALKEGRGSGSLFMPASINTGNYHLRAYTAWMKNFSPDYFFEKPLSIVNAQRSPEVAAASKAAGYDVQLFPEGGHLVTGLASKLAFKVTGADGVGPNTFRGAIIDQKNDTVARFAPQRFGMGNLMFTPQAGNTYRAVIKVAKQNIIKPIPAVDERGYVMQVADRGQSWEVTVKTSGTTDNNLFLLAHTRQSLKQATQMGLNNGAATFTISKDKLGEGVSNITLFNSAMKPVCERLVFKMPTQRLTISAGTDAASYSTRQKVSLAITAKDEAQKPRTSDLSVSVYRTDALQMPAKQHILSYLWLTSELKGNIEDPAYYFENGSQASEALDNLLLTQGWRRFEWDKVMTGKPEIRFMPEYTGHIINGKLVDLNGQPAPNINAYLSIPGNRVQLFSSKSDSLGRLFFNTKDLYGAGEVVLQTDYNYDSTYRVQLLDPFAERASATMLPNFSLNPDTRAALENNSIGMQAQNIYWAPKLREFYNPMVDSAAFYGKPNKIYFLDAYVRFTSIEEVFREYTSWLFVTKSRGKFKVKMFNEKKLLDGNPLVMYNGIPFFDMNRAFAIDPLKVKRLEVVNSKYFYGSAGYDGILSMTGYKDDMAGVEIDPRAVILDYEGLQLERKFYSPVYDTEQQRNSRMPDLRNALYWQPDAFTDQAGKHVASFYTSDQPGRYVGVVQGMTATGQCGSQVFNFEVK